MNTLTPLATADAETASGAAAQPTDFFGLGIADVRSAEFEVKNPLTGAGTGLFIELAGPEHPLRRERALQMQRDLREAMEKRMAETGKWVPVAQDPEDNLRDSMELLVLSTLGWHRNDGKPVPPFSEANVRALYAHKDSQWIVRQVSARINDLALFIKA